MAGLFGAYILWGLLLFVGLIGSYGVYRVDGVCGLRVRGLRKSYDEFWVNSGPSVCGLGFGFRVLGFGV